MVDGELLYAKRLLQTLHSTSLELSVHTLANLHTQLFLGVIGYLEGIQLILKKNQAVRKSEIDIICNNFINELFTCITYTAYTYIFVISSNNKFISFSLM